MTFNQRVAGSNPTELTNKRSHLRVAFFVGLSERMRTREKAGSTPSERHTLECRSALADEREGGAKRNYPTELTNKRSHLRVAFFVGLFHNQISAKFQLKTAKYTMSAWHIQSTGRTVQRESC